MGHGPPDYASASCSTSWNRTSALAMRGDCEDGSQCAVRSAQGRVHGSQLAVRGRGRGSWSEFRSAGARFAVCS